MLLESRREGRKISQGEKRRDNIFYNNFQYCCSRDDLLVPGSSDYCNPPPVPPGRREDDLQRDGIFCTERQQVCGLATGNQTRLVYTADEIFYTFCFLPFFIIILFSSLKLF